MVFAELSQPPAVDAEGLEKAIFFRLRIGTPTTKRAIRRKGEVIKVETDTRMLHIYKDLFKASELQAIDREDRRIKAYLKWNTIPLPDLRIGTYAATVETIESVDRKIGDYKSYRQKGLVPALIDAYDRIVSDSRARLQDLYDPADYPSHEELRAGFTVELEYRDFGKVPTQLPWPIRQRELERGKEKIDTLADSMKKVLRVQMAELVTQLANSLAPDEKTGKKKRIYDSMIDRFEQFLDTFQKRQIASDEELTEMVDRAKALLSGVDPEILRKSDNIRETVAAGFAEVKTRLEQMIVEAPDREIRLDDNF
jgi:hypothetical protein